MHYKPSFWDTPRGLWTVVVVASILTGAYMFWTGWEEARRPIQPLVVHLQLTLTGDPLACPGSHLWHCGDRLRCILGPLCPGSDPARGG